MSLHDPNAPSFPTAQKVFGREDMIVVNRNDKDPDVSFNLWRISRHLWIRLHSIRSFLDCMPGDISKEKRGGKKRESEKKTYGWSLCMAIFVPII